MPVEAEAKKPSMRPSRIDLVAIARQDSPAWLPAAIDIVVAAAILLTMAHCRAFATATSIAVRGGG